MPGGVVGNVWTARCAAGTVTSSAARTAIAWRAASPALRYCRLPLPPGARPRCSPSGYPVTGLLAVWVAHLFCPWSMHPDESPAHVVPVVHGSRCRLLPASCLRPVRHVPQRSSPGGTPRPGFCPVLVPAAVAPWVGARGPALRPRWCIGVRGGGARRRWGRLWARYRGADGWYGCRWPGWRATVWAGLWVGPRSGQGVMPPVPGCQVLGALVSGGAGAGRWLPVRGARGFLRPCARIRLRRPCRVVMSAPPLSGRHATALVPGECALWWCVGEIWAMLWCWGVALCCLLGHTFLPGARWVGP